MGCMGFVLLLQHNDEQHEQTFESVSAGASLTYPTQCSALRKGGHIVIKGHPCKVSKPLPLTRPAHSGDLPPPDQTVWRLPTPASG